MKPNVCYCNPQRTCGASVGESAKFNNQYSAISPDCQKNFVSLLATVDVSAVLRLLGAPGQSMEWGPPPLPSITHPTSSHFRGER